MNSHLFKLQFPTAKDSGIEFLYKFMNVEKIDYVSNILVDNKIYLAKPKQLNDPFEYHPKIEDSQEEYLDKFREQVITDIQSQLKDNCRKKAEEIVSQKIQNDSDYLLNSYNHKNIQDNTVIRIASFTTKISNLLLWAHYANEHRGICICFSTTKDPFSSCRAIKYQIDKPILQIKKSINTYQSIAVALTKSTDWEYEKEFRFLKNSDTDKRMKILCTPLLRQYTLVLYARKRLLIKLLGC